MRTVGQESKPIGNVQAKQPLPDKPPLSRPVVTQSVSLDCSPNSIEVFKDGTICICERKGIKLKLLYPNGKLKIINLDRTTYDIAIHPPTEQLYAACGSQWGRIVSYEVRKIDIHSGASSVVFTTEHKPISISLKITMFWLVF